MVWGNESTIARPARCRWWTLLALAVGCLGCGPSQMSEYQKQELLDDARQSVEEMTSDPKMSDREKAEIEQRAMRSARQLIEDDSELPSE